MGSSAQDIVESRSGRLRGRRVNGAVVFRGIPYARPPTGALRFCAPQPPEPWGGIRDAGAFGPSAPQGKMFFPLPGSGIGATSEDCLFLNVATPAADGRRRPVLVWIHGGGFVIGSGSQPLYDAAPLARRGDVVVVTLNYRLGPLGFLDLASVCPDLEGAVANAGIRDQVAALEWVRDNIAAFGGDPANVTLFGESAGGMSVGTLLAMPSARGLFHRATAQSGGTFQFHTRESAARAARRFLGELGVEPSEAARVLRELPARRLLDTHQQTVFKLGRNPLLAFEPVVDGDSLPVSPLEAVQTGSAARVPLLVGTTRDEWNLFGALDPELKNLDDAGLVEKVASRTGGADAVALIDAYRCAREGFARTDPVALYLAIESDRIFRIPSIRLAEAHSRREPRTFMYLVTWKSPAMEGSLGACHGVELPLVFGTLGRGMDWLTGGGPEANAISERMMDAWIAFARSANPSHAGLPAWEAYEGERRATLLLGWRCTLEYAPAEVERRAWNGLL
jgi:para-nitrobenzyl esterase